MLSNKVAALKNSFFKKSLSTLVVRSFPSLARFSLVSRQKFCTQNNISEKEAMEMVEAGVFEVLKTAAKCKHNKLTRTASFEELGKALAANLRFRQFGPGRVGSCHGGEVRGRHFG